MSVRKQNPLGDGFAAGYWHVLETAKSATAAYKGLTSRKDWHLLKNPAGANPVQILLRNHPQLLVHQKRWPHRTRSLLSEVDAAGRDFWFYVLTAFSAGLYYDVRDYPTEWKEVIQAFPPKTYAAGQGWLGMLLSDSKLFNSSRIGTCILQQFGEVDAIQQMLLPESEDRQRCWVSSVLKKDWENTAEGLIVTRRLLSAMPQASRSCLIPEMRFSGRLGFALGYNNFHIGVVRQDFNDSELQELAASGLRFGTATKNSSGREPWLEPSAVPEWANIHAFLSDKDFSEGAAALLQTLEGGWRASVLATVDEMSEPENMETVPRL